MALLSRTPTPNKFWLRSGITSERLKFKSLIKRCKSSSKNAVHLPKKCRHRPENSNHRKKKSKLPTKKKMQVIDNSSTTEMQIIYQKIEVIN